MKDNCLNYIQKKSGLSLIITILVICQCTYAQDPTFSQFQNIPIYFNPSFAGTNESSRTSSIYKNKWPGSASPRQAFTLTYDQLVQPLKGGIGLIINYDLEIESISTMDGSLVYSPKLVLSEKVMLSPSIQLGYGKKSLTISNLALTEKAVPNVRYTDISTAYINTQTNYFNVSTGLLINTSHFFMGFSIHHINTPNVSLVPDGNYELDRKYVFMGGGSLSFLKKNFTFSPYLLFQRQYQIGLLSMNGILTYKNLSLGIGYRNDPAMVFLLGYELFKKINLRYSYEYRESITNASNRAGGIHEVSIQYLFNWKKKSKSEFKK